MRREQLAHILRAASRIVPDEDMLIIGSQAIHGTVDDGVLPALAMVSREVDVAFWNDPKNEHSDLVDAHLGEDSLFDLEYGYYAQGVSVTTATLPEGWRDRVVRFDDPSAEGARAWLLESHDLALSKLAAQREKDVAFVFSLVDAGLLDLGILRTRLETLPVHPVVQRNIASLLRRRRV